MPELPEVETIRLGLQKYLVGHTIEKVDVRLHKLVHGDTKHLIGGKVIDIKRLGKGLVVDLNNGYSIAIHIKLTGQLIYRDKKTEDEKVSANKVGKVPNKFTHVTFYLDKGGVLYYNDLRQFGWIKIVQSSKLKDQSFFGTLGPEFIPSPNSGQLKMTELMFKELLVKSTAIKPLLMDQTKIGGIGNIYANDALWEAKINPKRSAKSLSEKEIKTLYDAILMVLKKGLKYGGATELNYVNALGQEGQYQKHFLAYAQDGKPCKRCGTIMKKEFLGGRGTYYCPKCQR